MTFNDIYEDKVLVNREIRINDYDYICGEDHLIYCHRCHSPKQVKVRMNGTVTIRNCLCRCETERRDAEEVEYKKRQDRYRVQRLRDAGIRSPLARHYTFENDDGTNEKMFIARSFVDDWKEWKSRGKGLLITGGIGSGKSFFAGCIANGLIDNGVPAVMISTPYLTDTLDRLSGREAREYLEALDRYELLILDDYEPFLTEHAEQRTLFLLIDRWYTRRKPVIIVTGSSMESIREASRSDPLNGRIHDRILEMCCPVTFLGMDRRKERRSDNLQIARMILEKGGAVHAGRDQSADCGIYDPRK